LTPADIDAEAGHPQQPRGRVTALLRDRGRPGARGLRLGSFCAACEG
jgi:hypothetical protein